MDKYKYSLFFEARDMTDKELDKVRRHFQKRRDSGGGECGFVKKAAGSSYEIAFEDREDQERVLQRKFHTISLPGGELELTVSRTSPTETPDQHATTQPQTSRAANTKHLEKTYRLDVFLLYFLRDSPKAFKVLEKQLSSIGCEVAMDYDQEEAVVRGDVDKGHGGASGDAAGKWEQQVDRVIIGITESYICHHLVEAKQSQLLLQDLSFVNEDVRVYTDSGYAVLVGLAEAVNERVAILKKSVLIQREKQIPEEQLGLIAEAFHRDVSANHPQVQLSRGTGIIVLKGQEVEVQSAMAALDKLIGKIKHREIQFPDPLMDFINLSGAISKFQAGFQQSLRDPVSMAMGSGLVLSSLSTDALDEVEATVVKSLRMSTLQLEGAAAVPPDFDKLKVILIQARNEANRHEVRVEVSFIRGGDGVKVNTVQLVGYAANVLRFEEIIQDYQANNVTSQDIVYFSNPDLADCVDEFLELTGIKPNDVTLKVSAVPTPCVILFGPRRKVQEVKQAFLSAMATLVSDTLLLEGTGAQRYYRESGKASKELVESSFQVIIREQQCAPSPDVKGKQRSSSTAVTPVSRAPVSRSHSSSVDSSATSRNSSSSTNKVNVAIKLGSLENEQVNVLVAPITKKQLTSTNISQSLLNKAGNALQSKFDSVVANCTLAPGDVLQVDGPPSLGCSKIFFIECLPWDGVRGKSVQALGKGLRQCLDLCAQQGFSSLAFPVIGPEQVLKYPLGDAIQVLADTVCWFGSSVSSSSLSTINLIIEPGCPESEELFRDLNQHLNRNQGGNAIFRSLSSDLDEIAVTFGGGVRLRLVFGDIADEMTDVVVNTTDFTNFGYDGVCKKILAVAGPAVEAELKAASINQERQVFTQPGQFPCKAILHVCGEKTPGHVEGLTERIIRCCETKGYTSVAIPAICTGVGGMQPDVAAGAMLRGIRTATTPNRLQKLRDIRVVLYKSNVFLAFQEEAKQMFSTVYCPGATLPRTQQQDQQLSATADLSLLSEIPASQQSVFLVLGLSRKSVDDAKAKLRDLFQDQCSTHTIKSEELDGLVQEDIDSLIELVETHGLYLQNDQLGNLLVSGLKDGINQVTMVINSSLQGTLRREVRIREEEDLYTRVVWCIMNHNGHWERLPKAANYNLEQKDVAGGVVDAQGVTWTVDLKGMEATNLRVAETRKIKRLENLPDFAMPLYWDSMDPSETLKVVTLSPSSAEYRAVKSAFAKTVTKTVTKIERLQNIHLRRAYEVQKTHISQKNANEGGAGEKLLYHGTTEENYKSITKTGFNRRFAGQNATVYGVGVYFAVNARYSANPKYSKPMADHSQVMFVARVLTGVFTKGDGTMKVPPARDIQRPHDRYDSVVDNTTQPNMYVVFHDNQSYPDYLITFK